jgi:hypothetical protein
MFKDVNSRIRLRQVAETPETEGGLLEYGRLMSGVKNCPDNPGTPLLREDMSLLCRRRVSFLQPEAPTLIPENKELTSWIRS